MDLVERNQLDGPRHPWERARADFFSRVLDRAGLLGGAHSWLDVGAGDAWLATQLRSRLGSGSSVVCWDVNYTDADLAADVRLPGEGIHLTATRPQATFDRILLLDVIEHVEDDVGFLTAVVDELLRPGGFALVSVPAYQAMFSSHDVALLHHRRYSPRSCRSVLRAAGLELVSQGGLFHGLLVARAAQVAAERTRLRRPGTAGVGHWRGGPAVTAVVSKVLHWETGASLAMSERKLTLPGLSYWALCRAAR